jgi:biopolymer transport protein ExbD
MRGQSVWSPSRAAAQRAAKRKSVFYFSMNLWPFVGILIALLCLFLVNAPPTEQNLPIDRARSSHATAQPGFLREDAMRVFVNRDGMVFFSHYAVTPNELIDRVHGALREGAGKKIYLSVDARSRYGDTEIVVDQLRLAGIDRICFITENSARR